MKYKQELFKQQTPYLQWLKQQQQQLAEKYCDLKYEGEQMEVLPFSFDEIISKENVLTKLTNTDLNNIQRKKIYVFVNKQGYLNEYAMEIIAEHFDKYPETAVLYADEDYCGTLQELYNINEDEIEKDILDEYDECKAGKQNQFFRGEPWFKPEYSPDTLKSFFYFGSVFAIKGEFIFNAYNKDITLYELVLSITKEAFDTKQQIAHLDKVLFTNANINYKTELFGYAPTEVKADVEENTLISVIIPSKDNYEIIKRCLNSLVKNTICSNYEIIVVDNGSSDEEKSLRENFFEKLKKEKGINILSIYQQQNFNFSKMCNIGAKAANGEYLLFLNDDIEFFENKNWLNTMLIQAKNLYTGAVGVKLYYPKADGENYRIQHAGITNMGVGPSHKLGGMEDIGNLYHGHNIAIYNMLAVTAACLMVRKKYFELVGGFDEELAIAYNDVELCFKLYEKGFFNVVRNDIAIIHHESLTRGQDSSEEKQQRLFCEKQLLYKKHPKLFAKDPFYSENLIQWKKETEYKINYQFECDKVAKPQKLDVNTIKTLPYEYKNKLMRKIAGQNQFMVEIDSVDKEVAIDEAGEKRYCVVKGWSVVRNSDNSEFDRTILLKNTDESCTEIYSLNIFPQLRTDVEALFVNEKAITINTSLSGMQVIFEYSKMSKGTYQIGILMKKPNKRYIKWTDKTVTFNK